MSAPHARTFELESAMALLARTPATLRALLDGLGPEWTEGTYGPGTFSPADVVAHLITGEQTDWMTRVQTILKHGTTVTLTAYDRYAHFDVAQTRSMLQLLDEFEHARRANLRALRALQLTPTDMARQGVHPALGAVTLEQLLATWVAHDLNHLAQIARAMAAQYEAAVGPWKQYLGIYRAPATAMDDAARLRREAALARREEKR